MTIASDAATGTMKGIFGITATSLAPFFSRRS
jgi:hypothetical protein